MQYMQKIGNMFPGIVRVIVQRGHVLWNCELVFRGLNVLSEKVRGSGSFRGSMRRVSVLPGSVSSYTLAVNVIANGFTRAMNCSLKKRIEKEKLFLEAWMRFMVNDGFYCV
jgi:hypothetical protein